tara:strand:- start:207 stop:1013 length:807 start_codon:yes stop_codon:yes gene_type:complete
MEYLKDENLQSSLTLEQVKEKNYKIFIGTPCYGGMLAQEYVNGILNVTFQCLMSGIPVEIYLAGNESLIPRGRNHIVAEFMASNSTHLLFIDADIRFSTDSVFKLLRADRGVTCGAYPLKKVPIEYVINFPPEAQTNSKEKLVEVTDCGTGFMMIKREAIAAMQDAHPELHYTGDLETGYRADVSDPIKMSLLKENLYSLFDTMHDTENNNNYLSEDFTFCRRWQNSGGKVWLDPTIKLDHLGKFTYTGDVSKIIDFDNLTIDDTEKE